MADFGVRLGLWSASRLRVNAAATGATSEYSRDKQEMGENAFSRNGLSCAFNDCEERSQTSRCLHTRVRTHTHAHMHIYTHISTPYMHVRTHITHTYTHTYTSHIHTHIYTNTYTRVHMHTQTCMYRQRRTCTHATHTHTHSLLPAHPVTPQAIRGTSHWS